MVLVYFLGILVVAFVVACCALAREGSAWAGEVAWIVIGVVFGLSSIALLLSLFLMLAGCSENCSGDDGWWTQGQGQQFLASGAGWLLLASAVLSLRRRHYFTVVVLIVSAAALFGLWGLLVEAGWSARGPLALGSF